MIYKAKLKNLRIAPRKVRAMADLIRGKNILQARAILNFTVKGSSLPLLKLLESAIANVKNNFQIETDNLCVSKIIVDEGRKLKRWMPRARGSASPIQKKTSHITIELEATGASSSLKNKKSSTAKMEKSGNENLKKSEDVKFTRNHKDKPKRNTSTIKSGFTNEKSLPAGRKEKNIKRLFMRKAV
jgi:large subunit ribosomal protein L22